SDMCRIVDGRNCKTYDEVDHNDRQDARPDRALEKRWNRTPITYAKHQQDAEQTENSSRRTGRNRLWMIKVAAADTCYPGQHVKNNETSGAIKLFYLGSDNPQRIGIEDQMQHADMDKDRSDEPPPLALRNLRIRLDTECDKCPVISAPAGERHQNEHNDI